MSRGNTTGMTLGGVHMCATWCVVFLTCAFVCVRVRSSVFADSFLRDDHVEKVSSAIMFRRSVDRLDLSDNPKIGIDGMRQ